jgi:activator of HSP90 ATPase
VPNYNKYYILPAEPAIVYAALTTAITIQLWTGDKVEFEPVPDTEFSLWDGSIVGRNISFVQDKEIVQEWYFGDDNTEPSIVTIKLHEHKKGTSAELRHTNIPEEAFKDICEGWDDAYFGNLQNFYSEG